jgi:hypothetical protein
MPAEVVKAAALMYDMDMEPKLVGDEHSSDDEHAETQERNPRPRKLAFAEGVAATDGNSAQRLHEVLTRLTLPPDGVPAPAFSTSSGCTQDVFSTNCKNVAQSSTGQLIKSDNRHRWQNARRPWLRRRRLHQNMPKCSIRCRSSMIRFKCCSVSRVALNLERRSNTPILNMHSSSNSHLHNAHSSSSCPCTIRHKRALLPQALLKCKGRISAAAEGSRRRARTLAQLEPTVEPPRTGGAQECHRAAL